MSDIDKELQKLGALAAGISDEEVIQWMENNLPPDPSARFLATSTGSYSWLQMVEEMKLKTSLGCSLTESIKLGIALQKEKKTRADL